METSQTDLCAYLSAVLSGGLDANAPTRRWWADPVVALLMAPFVVKEGVAGLRGGTRGGGCR